MISKRLQDVMQEKGWSQSELAKKINTNRVQVNRWLHAKAIPTKNSIRRIATATGCRLNWLLTGEGEMFPDTEHLDYIGYLQEIGDETKLWEAIEEAKEEAEWLEEEARKKAQQQTISQLLAKTAVVLESDTMHHGALAGVINALYRAVRLEEKTPPSGLKDLRKISERP